MDRSDIEPNQTKSPALEPLADVDEGEAWAMVESSPDGMILTDEHGIMVFVNRQVEQLFGFDRGEILGRPVEILLPERHRAPHRAHRTRYRASPTTRSMGAGLDLRAQHRDGTEFPVEVSLSPIHGQAGLRVVATVRDISDRVADDADNRAVWRALDAARDAVFMFDVDTLRFSYVNAGASAQLDYSRDELMEMTPLAIKPEFTEASFRQMIAPVVAGAVESHMFTTLHRRSDGTDVPVEIDLEMAPSSHESDAPRLMTVIARDISDRLERQSAEADQSRSLMLLAERERLAADLHDLVIQRLFGAGMGLQSVQSLTSEPRVTDRIGETINELDRAIADLRASIFKLTVDPAEELMAEIQLVMADATRWLGFEPSFVVVGRAGLIPQLAAAQLLPVLTETLSNVARHAEATEAGVELVVTSDHLTLTVTDNGKGIDPDVVHGNGLHNLELRAKRLGGATSIGLAAEGTGTKVIWTARFAAEPPGAAPSS